jgi:tetratricopeptide (TPR) repeat protein
MKGKKNYVKPLAILLGIVVIVAAIVVFQKVQARNSLADQIAELSPRGAPPQSIEDLRKAITLYEAKIEEHVKDTAQTGIYWKILANRLVDKKLYGEALEALERAVYYYPEDVSLHYLIGISAGEMAKSAYFPDAPESAESYYRISEQGYLRALELSERYTKAMYGLSVLYVFELDRPAEAIPLMLRFLDINTGDISAMFLLARAYYMTSDFEAAAALYDRIISKTKDAKIKARTEELKKQVLDAWYG